jgi:uncharacterized membrane protein
LLSCSWESTFSIKKERIVKGMSNQNMALAAFHQLRRFITALLSEESMSTIDKAIEVNVPVSTAYNQWTQFEDFPKFMEGVEEVRQLDDTHQHWCANIGGKRKEWDAVITEQVPDQRIAWQSTSGAPNGGVVTFHRIDDNTTNIMLQVEYDPQGIAENVADAVGIVSSRVEGDLERFKDFIESRGQETGAWRGQVQQGQPRPQP